MRILTEEMLRKIQHTRKTDTYFAYLIDHAVIDRARDIASQPGIRRPEEPQDWWRCLNRLGYAALACALEPDEVQVHAWLHNALMEIARMLSGKDLNQAAIENAKSLIRHNHQ